MATHEDLLRAVTGYLGQLPWLYAVDLWYSPPNETVKGSQRFHYDHRDDRQPKLFINLIDVSMDAGPLHFLSAAQSEQFNSTAGYTQKKIDDEEVYSVIDRADVKTAAGDQGTGFFLDTGRCLHYGSRGNKAGRLLFMANYLRVNCTDPGSGTHDLDKVRRAAAEKFYADDPIRTFVLTAQG